MQVDLPKVPSSMSWAGAPGRSSTIVCNGMFGGVDGVQLGYLDIGVGDGMAF